MVTPETIINDEAYAAALAEFERLWGAKTGTPEGDRLDALATLIDAYEARRFPTGEFDTRQIVRHRSSEFSDAVEALYAEFRVTKPRTIEGCPCCTAPEEVCMLLAKSLRDLTPEDLSNYGSSLFLTMGDENDFEYFLPRLFDVAANQHWWPSPEVLLGKLKRANWTAWTLRRREAVKRTIDTWFADEIAALEGAANDERHFIGSELDPVLCGIARAGIPVRPYLDVLADHPVALRFLYECNANSLHKKKRLSNPFWLDCPPAEAEVIAYFETPIVRERLDLS